ncbi:MAG: hypothetical protein U0793_03485 [Gemmataceae bacterium]
MSVALSLGNQARKRRAKRAGRKPASRLSTGITLALGCGIPSLAIALSRMGGCLLASGSWVLGVMALGLCVVTMLVSLQHLAFSVQDITRSSRYASLSMAVAVDASIVLAELVGVFGAVPETETLRACLISVTTCFSMALNCWAFLRHK